MTLSSRERAQRLLKDWSIDPKTVLDDDYSTAGYWRLGEAPKGYLHPRLREGGVVPKHWVPWPDRFPAEEFMALMSPFSSGGYTTRGHISRGGMGGYVIHWDGDSSVAPNPVYVNASTAPDRVTMEQLQRWMGLTTGTGYITVT